MSDLARIDEWLAPAGFGRPLSVLDRTTSTNDVARNLAENGAPHGATVIADHQTSGRGSHGRSWYSPPGVNLHLSIVLRPELTPARLPLLSLAIGLAVCDTVDSVTGLHATVKWPNDVWLGRLKVAGILLEASSTGVAETTARFVVAGIGIDVNLDSFPDELADSATSLRRATGRPLDRAVLATELLTRIAHRVRALESGADIAIELAARAALVGEPAFFDGEPCVVLGVDSDGSLRIRTPRGIERKSSGRLTRAS